jgi:hypothetical protein
MSNVYGHSDFGTAQISKNGQGGGGNGMEPRVAKLESDVDYIKRDIGEIKADVKDIKSDITDIKLSQASLFGKILLAMLTCTGIIIASIKFFLTAP